MREIWENRGKKSKKRERKLGGRRVNEKREIGEVMGNKGMESSGSEKNYERRSEAKWQSTVGEIRKGEMRNGR